MSNRVACLLTASALAFAAGAAQAQSNVVQSKPVPSAPAAKAVSGVEVQVAPTPSITYRQSWDFVQGFTAAPNPELDQMARWYDPVCVQTFGLSEAQARAIQGRIQKVARDVGLKAPAMNCRPNVEIVFTAQPQAFMDGVYQKRSVLLGYYHTPAGEQLKTVSHPIQAWYLSATRSTSGGFASIDDQDTSCFGRGCFFSTGLSGAYANHFRSGVESMFANVLVVADTRALQGKDVGLLSDYLAMITLAQPRHQDDCRSLPSVLEMLSPNSCPHDAPDGLSPADAAYLTSLYKADLSEKKSFEWGDISDRMADILIKAKAPK